MLFSRPVKAPIVALGLLVCPLATLAADLGAYRPYSPSPQYNGRRPLDGSYRRTPLQQAAVWSGLYVGMHGGGGWGSADGSALGTSTSFDTSGYLFGAHAGYNFQFGQTVAGVEVDGTWTDIDGGRTFAGDSVTATQNWMSSLRGRLGYAVNDWILVYATGGVAFAGTEVGLRSGGLSATSSETLVGYAVGGGVDLKLMENVSARLEALHYDFGAETFRFAGGTVRGDADVTTVRAGISFHFN